MRDQSETGCRTPLNVRTSSVPAKLALAGVSKSFGHVSAVSDLHIDFQAGEIHAVLGENGAGKTTLMHIIAGLTMPDQGDINVDGQPVSLRKRGDGILHGIGLVQQHYGLVHELTGTENFLLGDPRVTQFLDKSGARQALAAASTEFDLAIDPDQTVGALSIGERQRLEILIALASGADILILDEPTAALVSADASQLIKVMRQLAGDGKTVVFVTHKLREVIDVADKVTVMRNGSITGEFDRATMSESALTTAMIGTTPVVASLRKRTFGAPVLKLRNVSIDMLPPDPGLRNIDLEIREGEILGVAGVDGNGQTTLARVAARQIPVHSGQVDYPSGPIGYVPEDRAHEGLANDLTLGENAIVHQSGNKKLRTFGMLSDSKVSVFTQALLQKGNVKAQTAELPASALSGGNQQKLVVARELERNPAFVVAENPYRGLDLGAAAEVRARLLEQAENGKAVLLISPDLEDLFQLASSIVVMSAGAIVGKVDPSTTTTEEIGALIGGAAND